jgi:flagellar transcriptional activator FlhC
MLQLSTCSRCNGRFVAHAHDLQNGFVCVLCRPPSRAGKTRKLESPALPGADLVPAHGYMPLPVRQVAGLANGGLA